MKNLIIDTGFWFALYDEKDQHHPKAMKFMENQVDNLFLIPFPTLYETLNTAFSKNKNLPVFKTHIYNECQFIHDDKYKLLALEDTFESSINRKRPLSLVDMIIRHMLADVDLNINGLVSFNPGDFEDVCRNNRIELVSHYSIPD
ncbi:MAG: hypothetical protein K2J65_06925 [Duncaniella sp.]|nr:hypothetical protein [Duncaniella sp.]